MNYILPKALSVCGTEYDIRSDFRAVLDICAALNDAELNEAEKGIAMLGILYEDFGVMPPEHYQDAVKQCCWFIDCGMEEDQIKTLKLMDWEQDFPYIVAPINRIAGADVRGMEYLHWWTFVSFYYEIGDCLFAHIVRIRDKLAKRKKLDKAEWEWYRKNRRLVDIKTSYTEKENALLEQWGVK